MNDSIDARSVHQRAEPDEATRAIVPPVVRSAAFAFPDLDSWERAVAERREDIYGRNSNPTVRRWCDRVAALEGAEDACAFSTGMAAVTGTLMALLKPGSRVVTVRDAYGATFLLFTRIFPDWGVDCVVLDTDDEAALEREIDTGCDLLYLESPTNPALRVVDLEALCSRARARGATCVVDNTFATPVNQRPLELGADLVIHSATKYLCGLGDALGGIVCGDPERVERIHALRELTGASLDAGSASLLLRSLRTLALRVGRQNANGQAVAEYLAGHPAVERVLYPGLPEHPGHAVAARQMSGFGGVLSFVLRGGEPAVRRVLPRLRLARLAANLGQVETTVGPAYLTSHIELTPEEREATGVPDHLVRYACGIEDADALCGDLEAALAGEV